MDSGLAGLLGLARKAGRLELGEEPVSAAVAAHRARLILLASDAAQGTAERIRRLAGTGSSPCLPVPLTKAQLGAAAGHSPAAVAAVTDVGLAAQAAKRLSQLDPDACGEAAEALSRKAEKAHRRRRAQREKEKAEARGRPRTARP